MVNLVIVSLAGAKLKLVVLRWLFIEKRVEGFLGKNCVIRRQPLVGFLIEIENPRPLAGISFSYFYEKNCAV